ncbi:hypothetical protein GLOTRDRAFT_139385 [Gloeophyllum trabeum ATCC 11539]|uniref:Zn(2)-C6 fungal-type domain-containing protein n=1 Tax=Gloeophyllum trabeum (strain ATCC 11539 / FP-39264 / Madison 617) TaxID=670483 RepID=S7Q338_GLOTA|nr:uncharacterized protein GLOTRDRAFT_139385 [Gloeophyllum trabeum ATCC 11539]EPQ53908.1 hypothetical protein GLOTRDRAFT_139385 [Gloeophyllum trabeum ATCC 11539]
MSTRGKDGSRGYGPARVSCEECRRMKSRCDKQRPCGPCIRRGCADICPNGTLPTRRVFRTMYADKEALQQKLEPLCNRIHELENALAKLSSRVSDKPHPLLSEDLLALKMMDKPVGQSQTPESTRPSPSRSPSPTPIDTLVDDYGTLTLGGDGRITYFGRSAGPEILLQVMRDADPIPSSSKSNPASLPPSLQRRPSESEDLFHGGSYDEPTLRHLESRLPSYARATSLCESYLEHSSWFFGPIQRDELINELLTPIYRFLGSQRDGGTRTYNPQKLAVLFLVLSHGALMDLTLAPYNAEAETYYQAGSSMVSMQDISEAPSIEVIQALGYMGTYHILCEPRYGLSSAWPLIAVAIKLSQAIGLHVDSAHWQLDPITVYRRRLLFWELVSQELPMSLSTGRPPSTHWDFVNCKMPIPNHTEAADVIDQHAGKRYAFNRDILWQAVKLTIGGQVPSYSAILDLDKKLNARGPPPGVEVKVESDVGDIEFPSPASPNALLGIFSSCYVRMYIHRPFFAKAFLDYPADPIHSPYGASVIATYRAALLDLKTLTQLLQQRPVLCQRFFFIWLHAFSAAIVVAFVAIKISTVSIASVAFDRLHAAIELFEKGGSQSHRAQVSLPVLHELREKAYLRLSRLPGSDLEPSVAEHLSTFVGRTKFKVVSSNPSSSAGSPDSGQGDMQADLPRLISWDQNIGTMMQSSTPQDIPAFHDPLSTFGSGASYDECRTYLDFVPRDTHALVGNREELGHDDLPAAVPEHMTFFSEILSNRNL